MVFVKTEAQDIVETKVQSLNRVVCTYKCGCNESKPLMEHCSLQWAVLSYGCAGELHRSRSRCHLFVWERRNKECQKHRKSLEETHTDIHNNRLVLNESILFRKPLAVGSNLWLKVFCCLYLSDLSILTRASLNSCDRIFHKICVISNFG